MLLEVKPAKKWKFNQQQQSFTMQPPNQWGLSQPTRAKKN
jgi:hypothetical protein